MKEKIEFGILLLGVAAIFYCGYYSGGRVTARRTGGFWITVKQTNNIVNVTATNQNRVVTTNFYLNLK